MEQCIISMRTTLAKRRWLLGPGWLGVLLFHTLFPCLFYCYSPYSWIPPSMHHCIRPAPITHHPVCLLTPRTPPQLITFPLALAFVFSDYSCSSPRFIPFHSCFYFISCPLSLIVIGFIIPKAHHYEEGIALLV
jgi:hypothetical protein